MGVVVIAAAVLHYHTLDNVVSTLYSAFILVWISALIKSWKRYQSELAFRWHVEGAKDHEPSRHEFVGKLARGFHTGSTFVQIPDAHRFAHRVGLERTFPAHERLQRTCAAYCAMAPLVLSALIGTLGILAYRSFLMLSFQRGVPWLSLVPARYGALVGSTIGGALNGLFIAVTNTAYRQLAKALTQYENHRTQTAHEDALILKAFLFEAVNSYASLFYIAFLKAAHVSLVPGHDEYCHDLRAYQLTDEQIRAAHGGVNPFCMGELSTQLSSLVITAQLANKAREFAVPRLHAWYNVWQEERGMRRMGVPITPMSAYEEQAKLDSFGGVFFEYNTLLVQLGYVVFFAPAFPVSALVCYVSNLIEIRSDAYKVLRNTRRPRCAEVRDIGSWLKVMWVISVIGVVTNLGLIGFTATQFSSCLPFQVFGVQVNADNKLTFLLVCEHAILAAKYFFANHLPDVPQRVARAKALRDWETDCEVHSLLEIRTIQLDAWDDAAIPAANFTNPVPPLTRHAFQQHPQSE